MGILKTIDNNIAKIQKPLHDGLSKLDFITDYFRRASDVDLQPSNIAHTKPIGFSKCLVEKTKKRNGIIKPIFNIPFGLSDCYESNKKEL